MQNNRITHKLWHGVKRGVQWLFSWLGDPRTAILTVITFLSLMWFVVDWCSDTTFRAMSDPVLYICNGFATLLLLLPWMLTRRVWVQLIVIAVVDGFCLANLMYNRTYLTAIPADSYGLVSNLADFTSSVTDSLRWKDAIFALILAVGGVWAYKRPMQRVARSVGRWMASTGVFLAAVAIAIAARGGFYNAYDSLVQSCYYYTCGVPTYTIAGHVVYNVMDNQRNATLSASDRAEVDHWLADHRAMQAPIDTLEARKSVVLIFCESLESWPIGKSVAGKPITPYLNSFVADNTTLYAPNMLTQVAAGHSIDAQLLMTAGMYPTTSGVYSMKYPQRYYPTLNIALKADREANSYLMTSDKLMTWNMGTIARTFGYDSLLHRDNWELDETINRHLTDGSFFRQAAAELQKGELWPHHTPAMVTLLSYTGHVPFELSDEMRDADFEAGLTKFPGRLRDYIAVTHYVDSQLHIIVDYLRSRPDADSTIIVIVGDHEALGTSRSALRKSSAEASELVSDGVYTPFIVLNSPVAGHYKKIMGQVDVLPTLLDLLGAKAEWRGMGQSILDPAKAPVAYTTVPLKQYGDTTAVSPSVLHHISEGPRMSSRIIVHDLLRKKGN